MDDDADHLQHAVVNWLSYFIYDPSHRRSRLRQLVNDDPELLVREILFCDSPYPRSDDAAQNFFGAAFLLEGFPDGIEMFKADRLLQNLRVESQFVAEMIVDKGDVGTGPGADVAHGRSMVSGFGKNVPRRFEQLVARIVGIRTLRRPAPLSRGTWH